MTCELQSNSSPLIVKAQEKTIKSEFIPCIKCKAHVLHMAYSGGRTFDDIEDDYRMLHSKLQEIKMPTWGRSGLTPKIRC